MVDRSRAAVRTPVAGRMRAAGRSREADQPDNQAAARSPCSVAFEKAVEPGPVVRHGLHPVGGPGISQSWPAPPARSVSGMTELKSRLRADLTQSMKSRDKLRTATLRMLLAAIQTEEVSGKEARELSDDEIIKVLSKESRKRGEAAEIYTQNGRGELAAEEHAEARIIDEYLPTPLTEAELADVADTAIAQVAEQLGERPGMKQMGLVMKAATAIAAGKADGARLSAAVKERL